MLGVTWHWTSIPPRGNRNTPSQLQATETGISSGSVGQIGPERLYLSSALRDGEWSLKKYGSCKILVKFHGSRSLVFWAVLYVLQSRFFCKAVFGCRSWFRNLKTQKVLVSQRKTLVSQSLEFTIRHPCSYIHLCWIGRENEVPQETQVLQATQDQLVLRDQKEILGHLASKE